ncbi:hypothetical protein Peur_062068 [Populus x canadensis]
MACISMRRLQVCVFREASSLKGLDNILLMLLYTETRSTLGAHFCQRKNLSILPTDVFALTM